MCGSADSYKLSLNQTDYEICDIITIIINMELTYSQILLFDRVETDDTHNALYF